MPRSAPSGAAEVGFALLGCLVVCLGPAPAGATSSKMDYLPLAHARTDMITDGPTSTRPEGCLSPHVHTFYGPAVSLHPTTSYEDLRKACGNSGSVKENKSLYWHPTVRWIDPALLRAAPRCPPACLPFHLPARLRASLLRWTSPDLGRGQYT